MESAAFLELLRQQRAIAVLRAPQLEVGLSMAQAAVDGGLRLIEITWDSDRPQQLVAALHHRLPHCCVGVGTVLSLQDLQEARAAGADFAFAPYTDPALLHWAKDRDWPMVPGALTPNEIMTAWQAGAPAVKVFPISAVGGASYVKSLQSPLGHIPLVPTGGITADNAAAMLRAGAIAVGLSTGLFSAAAMAQGDWAAITETAQRIVATCQRIPAPIQTKVSQ